MDGKAKRQHGVRTTKPYTWILAIICALLAVAVILTGIVVFVIYVIYQPRLPYLEVPYAHLDRLVYDQTGSLDTELTITIVAENDNARAHASFSDLDFFIKFHGIEIAELKADPFEVQKNSSAVLNYVVPSAVVPLDEGAMKAMDAALRSDRVPFDLVGTAKMRWRVGVFLSVKFWSHLSCRVEFSYANRSSVGLDCSSKERMREVEMGTGFDLMTSTEVFVTTPCSLAKILLIVGVRVTATAALTWLQLLGSVINFHVDLCCRVIALGVAVVTLPFRILATLQRERELEVQVNDMRVQLECHAWENRELEKRLERAIREREMIETVFEEIEEAYEKAMDRIDVLGNQLQSVKQENLRLSELHGKILSTKKTQAESDDSLSTWNTELNRKQMILRVHGDPLGNSSAKTKHKEDDFNVANLCQSPSQLVSRNITIDHVLEQRRVVAIQRSLFSSLLSLMVGIIIWKAENPCMPLVAALFTVVAMSLRSVVQFFSTIRNKPATDAVALLSINLFILGMLTSPSLPTVAEVLTPKTIKLVDIMLIWFGLSS
ncbi:hypothetical protein DsansV1_C29g0210021 [Dioscorea sansibarensis]